MRIAESVTFCAVSLEPITPWARTDGPCSVYVAGCGRAGGIVGTVPVSL